MHDSENPTLPTDPNGRCEITQLIRSQCAHCRPVPPPVLGTREQVYNLVRTGKPTANEIADRLGISVGGVHQLVQSLRSGRSDPGGRGRPSSGPVEPVFISCDYDPETRRHEYHVPDSPEVGMVYAGKRQRLITSQLRRLAGMLGVWREKYPQDVVVRIAHRGVGRLVEDLDDLVLHQDREMARP